MNKVIVGMVLLPLLFLAPTVSLFAQADTVDYTQYDLQAVGPVSNRIAVDNQGGVHVVYLQSSAFPNRHLNYGYRNLNGDWFNYNLGLGRAGFLKIALNSTGNPAILAGGFIWTPGGVRFADSTGYGLSISYDSQDNLHLLYYKAADGLEIHYILYYARSSDNGISWSLPQVVDSLGLPGAVVTSSPASNKSAIIYTLPIDSANAYYSDIIYVESEDGVTWDFLHGKINITDYDIGEYFATMDFDAIYDNTDLLNIVWVSQPMDTLLGPVYMWDYNANTGNIAEIAHTSIVWPSSGCDLGTWSTAFGKVSLASSAESDRLYVFYSAYSPYDCSAGGFANAEIDYQYSDNSGGVWSVPVDVTNTHNPGCQPGDCLSETNPSIARTDDDYLHLFYVEDKDAGGVPYTEGSITANPLVYLQLSETKIADETHFPSGFMMAGNYPNPFNAVTTIRFQLNHREQLSISVYDVTGARITTLLNDYKDAGNYSVKWDAGALSSGIYFCRAEAGEKSISQKMILLK
jgi:hypothetical protein